MSVTLDNAQSVSLLEQVGETARLMEQGRGIEGTIFLSKFTAPIPPLNLLGNLEPRMMDEEILQYRSRSPYGIPELQDKLSARLEANGIAYNAPPEEPRFICAPSVDNTLLPNLFRIRRTGGLCDAGDEVLVYAPTKNFQTQAQECGLDAVAIHGEKAADAITDALKTHPDARILMLENSDGAPLGKQDIDTIGRAVREQNDRRQIDGERPLIVVADETRSDAAGNNTPSVFTAIAANHDLRDCTISLNTLPGKGPDVAFAYAYGPPALIKEMASATFDGAPLASQQYAAAALSGKASQLAVPQSAPVHGTPELQHNLISYLAANDITYDAPPEAPRFVCGTSINSTLLPNLFRPRQNGGLFNVDDEVLVCTPIYGLLPFNAHDNWLKIVNLPGRKENGYKPEAKRIELALQEHPEARAIMLVNPANPTGACLDDEEIKEIGKIIHAHNENRMADGKLPLIVIVDETFHNLMWSKHEQAWEPIAEIWESIKMFGNAKPDCSWRREGPHWFTPFASDKNLKDYTISLNTFSKDTAPGIGFAYAYGPPELIREIPAFDGPDLETQRYAAAVFNEDTQLQKTRARHAAVVHGIYEIEYQVLANTLKHDINPALRKQFGGDGDYVSIAYEPDGGFHATLDFSGLKGFRSPDGTPLTSSREVAQSMMEHGKLVAYPGEMFHLPGDDMLLRASVNLEKDTFLKALPRLKRFCLSLEPHAQAQMNEITEIDPQGRGARSVGG